MNTYMVKQLVYRDFRAYSVQIIGLSIFMLVLSMFITFVNTHTLRIFTSGIGNIIMVVIGSFAMEQADNVVRMHTASLPVSRKEIVTARYISALLIVVVNTILHFVVFNLLEPRIHEDPQYTSPGLFVYAMMYGVFQLSIYYLIFYRVNLMMAVIIFVLPAVLWTTISQGADFIKADIAENTTYLLLFCAAVLIVFSGSYLLTVRYFNQKEL